MIYENHDLFEQNYNLSVSNQNQQIMAARIMHRKQFTALKGVKNEKLFGTGLKQILKNEIFYDAHKYFHCKLE